MVFKSTLKRSTFAFLMVFISPNLLAFQEKTPLAEVPSTLSKLFNETVQLFREHGVEVRESMDLDEELSTDLENSNQRLRSLHPNGWFKPIIRGKDDEILLVRKNKKYILVAGGANLKYQPLYNTKAKFRFTLKKLEKEPQTYLKNTFIVIQENHIAIANRLGKIILLKPGFHWLKKGEKFIESFDLHKWLQSVRKCEQKSDKKNKDAEPIINCIQQKQIAGFVLEKVIIIDSQKMFIRKKHDGQWAIVKTGLNLYAPDSQPNGAFHQIKKSSQFLTESLNIGTTGYNLTARFTFMAPPEKLFNKLSSQNDSNLSYAAHLVAGADKLDLLQTRIASEVNNALKIAAVASANDFTIASFHKAMTEIIEEILKKINAEETKDTYIIAKLDVLNIGDEDWAKRQKELYDENQALMKKEKQVAEAKKDNDRKQAENNDAYDISIKRKTKEDERQEIKSLHAHERKMEEKYLEATNKNASNEAQLLQQKIALEKYQAKHKKAKLLLEQERQRRAQAAH